MAVFMINICKFNGCGLTFPGLGDLIQHIEDTHIDYDPMVIEQKEQSQPSCIPLSYVLRFFTDAARKETINDVKKKVLTQNVMSMKCSNSSSSIGSSLNSSTPTGSELDDEEVRSDSEDSNDSWTTPEEFSAEFILSLAIKSRVPVANGKKSTVGWIASNTKDNNNAEKPFACPVPGCKKRYKNVNGIKYHSKNGHKKDGKVRKGFKCHCGKSYKTAQGLKNHTMSYHNNTNLTTITTPTGEILQVPTNQVTTLQPLRTVTLKQISASSLSSLGLPVKSIQSVVVTTKTANEILNSDNNKTTTLRVLKDINVPIVKNIPIVDHDNVIELDDNTEIFDNSNDFTNSNNIPVILEDQSDNKSTYKFKLQTDKDQLFKIIPSNNNNNGENERIQLQIKLPHTIQKLSRLNGIKTDSIILNQKDLGILTPSSSPNNDKTISRHNKEIDYDSVDDNNIELMDIQPDT